MTALIGFGPNTTVPVNARLRVVLGSTLLAQIPGMASFAIGVQDTFDKLSPVGHFIAVARPSVPADARTTTVDGLNKITRSGGALVDDLAAATNDYDEVRSIQWLSGDDAADITNASGATARDDASALARAKADADSLARSLADKLGTTITVVKWGAAIVALALVAYVVRTARTK